MKLTSLSYLRLVYAITEVHIEAIQYGAQRGDLHRQKLEKSSMDSQRIVGFGSHRGANSVTIDRRSTRTIGTGISGRRHWAGFGWVGVGEAGGGGGIIGHLRTLLWNEKHLGRAPWEVRRVQKKRMVFLVRESHREGEGRRKEEGGGRWQIGGALNKEDGIGAGVTPVSRWSDTTHKGQPLPTSSGPRGATHVAVSPAVSLGRDTRPSSPYPSILDCSYRFRCNPSLSFTTIKTYDRSAPLSCARATWLGKRVDEVVGGRIDKAGLAVGCRPERGRRKRRTGVAFG
ncbi:hypothetical protein C4D60_Mb02t22190 [Musa balbisiana]|uniref:Uncharacterized protein n=1 Tax=Musa balbisiana TaxID=52838 RepID=A0A4S8ICJ0_MUSBA|nr:hypothetical protein C4D60_Mb02t22190 [Musa balbisiana]